MWPFSRKQFNKDDLAVIKTVVIDSFKFKIKKINPILDFSADKMPQIFSDFVSRRQRKEEIGLEAARKAQKDMHAVIEAGLVDPQLVPIGLGDKKGKEDGITVEDLFRDGEVGVKLYFEILAHSLNRFKGLRGVFFSVRLRRLLYSAWQKSLANVQAQSPSQPESSA